MRHLQKSRGARGRATAALLTRLALPVLLACIPACTTEAGAAEGGLDPWKQSCACPGKNSSSQYCGLHSTKINRALTFENARPDSQDALGDWLACLGLSNKERERILEEGWDLGDFAVLSKGETSETASALRITRAKAWRVTRCILL